MKADKYKEMVEDLFRHCSHYRKGQVVPWGEIEGVMGRHRDEIGGRTIVKRLIRDMLRRRCITCLVEPEVGVRLLTDMETALEIPAMRQSRAKRQIRKGLKETEHVDRQNISERAGINLALQRNAMIEEQKQIARSLKEVEVLMRPSRRD